MISLEFMCRGYSFMCQIYSWKFASDEKDRDYGSRFFFETLSFFSNGNVHSFVRFSETRIFRFKCEDFRKSFPLRDWIEINSIGDVLWSSQSYHNAHISNNLSYDGFYNGLQLQQRRWCVSRCRIWFWTPFIFGVCIAKFKAKELYFRMINIYVYASLSRF